MEVGIFFLLVMSIALCGMARYYSFCILMLFKCFQALILQELEEVGPEYIGTICGSYRRGLLNYIVAS